MVQTISIWRFGAGHGLFHRWMSEPAMTSGTSSGGKRKPPMLPKKPKPSKRSNEMKSVSLPRTSVMADESPSNGRAVLEKVALMRFHLMQSSLSLFQLHTRESL